MELTKRIAAGLPVLGLLAASSATAQEALERHLPPAPAVSAGPSILDGLDQAALSGPDRPLGLTLKGVALITGTARVVPAPAPGITAPDLPGIDREKITAALTPFLGKPLSTGKIAAMQAALAGVWRKAGYPFVSVTVPPQEVTNGVLTLRAVEFRTGQVTDQTNGATAGQLRLSRGERVNAPMLQEDLDWLNRNPFNRIQAVFAPGRETAETDVTLTLTQQRPYSFYAELANTGSDSTGHGRLSFGGAMAGGPTVFSFNISRGEDLFEQGPLFGVSQDDPAYFSVALRADSMLGGRQALSIVPNYVRTMEFSDDGSFSFDTETLEIPVIYSTALSNVIPGHFGGTLRFGAEAKFTHRVTTYDGTEVGRGSASLVNLVAGWSQGYAVANGRVLASLDLRINPGGILDRNSDADWSDFTGGRVTQARYGYLSGSLQRNVGLKDGMMLRSELRGRLASSDLPDTGRMGLAGTGAVRGYDSADGSVDSGFVLRNELGLKPFAAAGRDVRFGPFGFLDIGGGRDYGREESLFLASVGAGTEVALNKTLSGRVTLAAPLAAEGDTDRGDLRLTAWIRSKF